MRQANFVLGALTLSQSLLPLAILIGCWYTDFTCRGDSMGGIMMLYGIGIFPINILLESILLIWLLVLLVQRKAQKASKFFIYPFYVSLAAFVVSLYVVLAK
jgi:hypothetical protein